MIIPHGQKGIQVELRPLYAVIQTHLQEEKAMDSLYLLMCMNGGLMLAAVVSAAQHQLSFFNAIQVQNLVWSVPAD